MTIPVSLEIAILLNTKGFVISKNIFNKDYYNHLGELNGDMTDYLRSRIRNADATVLKSLESIDAPSIAEVLMYLYDIHKLWILALPTVTGNFAYKIIDVQLDPENEIQRPPYDNVSAYDYNTPTEAYQEAILDIIKNL